jgi:hypothetical protein
MGGIPGCCCVWHAAMQVHSALCVKRVNVVADGIQSPSLESVYMAACCKRRLDQHGNQPAEKPLLMGYCKAGVAARCTA